MSDAFVPLVEDALAAVTDRRLRRFLAYVEDKRSGRTFAARGDLDPVDFPYMLGDIVILDVLYEPLRFRYRLVGSNLVGWRNYDLTGKFVHEHGDPEYRDFVLERYRETILERRITGGAYRLLFDGKLRAYQALRAPLSDDGKHINMIIAAFAMLPLEPRASTSAHVP